ncbi:MAG TPA: DUF2846 domain-containing protein [Hyphomicrobiaceae bacterium]|nr:DUF2846 domain-containing protein [Hyphomicrobiaceae bacterium]
MRGRIAMLAAALALAGCATSGPTGSEVLSLRGKPGTARLVIYRTSPIGFLIQPDYLVDGRRVGNSQPGAFVVCDLRPGRHTLSVANVPIAIPLTTESDSMTVTLRTGRTTYLRAEPRMGVVTGVIIPLHVDESQGRSDVASLHRSESGCGGA